MRFNCYAHSDERSNGLMVKDAIVERFKQLCEERDLTLTRLATQAGVTPSTVHTMMKPERRHISIVTIKTLCDGLDISIVDFFDCDLFRDLSPEIE